MTLNNEDKIVKPVETMEHSIDSKHDLDNMDFLKAIKEKQELEEKQKELEDSLSPKEKKKLEKKRSKESKKRKKFVDVNVVSNGRTILGQNSNIKANIVRAANLSAKSILLAVVFAIVFLFALTSLLFRFSTTPISGANQIPNTDIYYLPSSFRASTSSLKGGDYIIVLNQPSYIPVIYDYTVYQYHSRNGEFLNVTNSNNKEFKIEASKVNYIIKESESK